MLIFNSYTVSPCCHNYINNLYFVRCYIYIHVNYCWRLLNNCRPPFRRTRGRRHGSAVRVGGGFWVTPLLLLHTDSQQTARLHAVTHLAYLPLHIQSRLFRAIMSKDTEAMSENILESKVLWYPDTKKNTHMDRFRTQVNRDFGLNLGEWRSRELVSVRAKGHHWT